RRVSAPAGAGPDLRLWRQRGSGGAPARPQCRRFQRRQALAAWRLRPVSGRGVAAPGAPARRQALRALLRQHAGGDRRLLRLRGVVLLDALYGELDTFAHWITSKKSAFFVSSYTRSTAARNLKLQKFLAERHIPFTTRLEPRLEPGSIAFLPAPEDADHRDF